MKVDPAAVRAAILELLALRAGRASVCPSEVARAVAPQSWRNVMDAVREAGWMLVAEGCIDVTQHDAVVGCEARGLIRFRLRSPHRDARD